MPDAHPGIASALDPELELAPGSSIAEQALGEFETRPIEYQAAVRACLRSRFARVREVIVERRYRDAEFHAQDFVQSVNAVKMQHSDSVDRASQALDRFVLAARSAVDGRTDGDGDSRREATAPGKLHWFEPAGSLLRSFELNQRAFLAGTESRETFMSGHDVVVEAVLSKLRERLGLWISGQRIMLAPQEQILSGSEVGRRQLERVDG